MKNTVLESSQTAAQGRGACDSTKAKTHQILKLAIDAHSRLWVIQIKIDHSKPEAIRQFKDRGMLLAYVRQCTQKADVVYSVYEAGATGFDLHRELVKLDVHSLVMAAEKLDDNKTDRIDTAELLNRLDCYIAGNTRAFTSVRVPTLSEEMRRQRSRLRDDFQKAFQAANARGRSLALLQGLCLSGPWWRLENMKIIRQWAIEKFGREDRSVLATFLWSMLCHAMECRRLQPIVNKLGNQLSAEYLQRRATTAQAERKRRNGGQAPQLTPKQPPRKKNEESETEEEKGWRILPSYFGAMTAQILDAEICNWDRLGNVRQVGGFFGLAPRSEAVAGSLCMVRSVNAAIPGCGLC